MPLSTIVLGGYLGAGKTTLLNHLLRHAQGRRIAVMVNDFGDIGIDADLIESSDGEVMNLAGGCLCCSVGSDLIAALMALAQRLPPPDLVLIETSGVALPGAVAQGARLAPGIEVDAVVVLVDAETIRVRADDRHVGDTVRQQLAEADLLVLNKTDLIDAQALAACRDWLAGVAPRARIIESVDARVPPELILGPGLTDTATASHWPVSGSDDGEPRLRPTRTMAAGDRFESLSFTTAGAHDAPALAAALCDPALGVLRAKGLIQADDGRTMVIQTVGARWRVNPATTGLIGAGQAGRLVVIGLRRMLAAERIGALLAPTRRDH